MFRGLEQSIISFKGCQKRPQSDFILFVRKKTYKAEHVRNIHVFEFYTKIWELKHFISIFHSSSSEVAVYLRFEF